jgi:Asp-tRNA(Asn)/Glu-tRNA(Gln) amidotransferase C subunit
MSSIRDNSVNGKQETESTLQGEDCSNTPKRKVETPKIDVDALLSEPTWSVQSLLPTQEQSLEEYPIAIKHLQHLLRLSALPPPNTMQDEAELLSTLASQLHFVKEIQKVDTTGVEPLRALRDETLAAESNDEITLDSLKDALAQEDIVGRQYKRIRRRQKSSSPPDDSERWQPLNHAQRRVGKYFTVDTAQTTNG